MTTRLKTNCKVDADGGVNLNDILNSFNAPIKEEHTWALCYQCVRFFIEVLNANEPSFVVRSMSEVFLRKDGNIHPKTTYAESEGATKRHRATSEMEIIVGLGTVLYSTLDHCYNEEEERVISEPLGELMYDMISDQCSRTIHETDDEGIERDSEDTDMSNGRKQVVAQLSLKEVLQRCESHVSILTKAQVECHYKAVVRAFVTEALELSMFLDIVAKGDHLGGDNAKTTLELDQLQFVDWSQLWMTVIAELRMGVKLKKVNYGRAPIEYELTPYEILMKDIRNYKQNLRKVTKDVSVCKHAQDIILEFIRSRPPLKKASDRKLAPRPRHYTPREQLMHSIRKGGRPLRKAHTALKPPDPDLASSVPNCSGAALGRVMGAGASSLSMDVDDMEGTSTKRRLIAVDFSQIDDDEEEEDEEEEDSASEETNLWTDEVDLGRDLGASNGRTMDKYDLALSYGLLHPTLSYRSGGNSSINPLDPTVGSRSVPQSRPDSRTSCGSSTTDAVGLDSVGAGASSSATFPSGTLDQLSLDNRLSLTLEEIVHIRTVLTKAEIEALPIEAHVRTNVENRKICFLCLKTKFSVFGPWGHRCILCQCTVCTKCSGRMHLPMEHFASVPVVLLSPSIMATPDDSLGDEHFFARSNGDSGGSGRSTPDGNTTTRSPITTVTSSPSRVRPNSSIDRFKAKAAVSGVVERLRADSSSQMMVVCHDCRAMVLQIIRSAQTNRSAIRNKHLQSLTLDLSPMF